MDRAPSARDDDGRWYFARVVELEPVGATDAIVTAEVLDGVRPFGVRFGAPRLDGLAVGAEGYLRFIPGRSAGRWSRAVRGCWMFRVVWPEGEEPAIDGQSPGPEAPISGPGPEGD